MSDDLIKRSDAIEVAKAFWYKPDIAGALAELPTIEPKRGEWIPCTKGGLPLTELSRREGQKWYGYKCSKCNFIYKGNALTESPFCQNCGTNMKGMDDVV